MKVVLDDLAITKGNPFNMGSKVIVHFEYQPYLDGHTYKFFVFAYVGNNENDYRFLMRVVYIVDFEETVIFDPSLFVNNIVNAIIPSLTDLIYAIDPMIKENDERH